MVKSALLQVTGKNSPIVTVLPPPVVANRAPRSSDIMPAGQLFIDSSTVPDTVYTSLGNGTFAAGGTGLSITGTANQITANTVGIAATLTLPATLVAPGSIAATTSITATLGNITATNGNIVRNTAGNKDVYTSVATTTTAGANSAGTVTLVGGTATVATTAVTANSIIRLYRQGIGSTGAAALGILTRGTISAGVSFIINAVQPADATALQASDVSSIGWEIVN